MGSVMSGVYHGFQYVIGCSGENELPGISDSSIAMRATPFVLKRKRYLLGFLHLNLKSNQLCVYSTLCFETDSLFRNSDSFYVLWYLCARSFVYLK